jgi:uncharacterized protein (DUF2141 family)
MRFWLMMALVIGITVAVGASARAQDSKGDGVITIHITGLRNDKGDMICTLCSSADGYPNDCKNKVTVKAPIAGQKSACVFPNKAPGDYAATVFHDEDSDGKFKRNFVGIPKEGFGFSNNFRPTVRAPTWDEGKFPFAGGQGAITIKIIYW